MKTIFLFVALLSIQLALVEAQTTDTIFTDVFSDNRFTWLEDDKPDYFLKVANDVYYFECRNQNEARTTTRNVRLDWKKDFAIEVSIKKMDGINENGFGLMIGKPNEDQDYNFLISGNGQYNVIKFTNNGIEELIPWTTANAIMQTGGNTNKLKVEKTGNTLKFYVNDTYLTRVAFDSTLFADFTKIGFVIHQNIKIMIDDLCVVQKMPQYSKTNTKLRIENMRFEAPTGMPLKSLQRGEIIFDLVNDGITDANDIEIRLTSNTPTQGLMLETIKNIQSLKAGVSATVKIPVFADETIDTGEKKFNVEIMEINNYDAAHGIISFSTQGDFTESQTTRSNPIMERSVETVSDPSLGCCIASLIIVIIAALF